jgi:segregation and condensation protein B
MSEQTIPATTIDPDNSGRSNTSPFTPLDDQENHHDIDLQNLLEALLFVAPGPVLPAQFAAALDLPLKEIEDGLKALEVSLQTRGVRLQWHLGRVQLTTAPEFAQIIEHFLGLEATSRLSRAALETLAIVAYQQPVTRPEIDAIRGVNSDGVLKSLLHKGLIQEAGRAERPGRPILYHTTSDFLGHFGLSSLQELPPLQPIETGPVEEDHPNILKT